MSDGQSTSPNRKRFLAEDKFKIVKEHLTTRTAVSELCRKHGMTPASFYDWQEQFFNSALMGFDKKRGPQPQSQKQDQEKEYLQTEINRMKDVIAEITAENIAYKKKNLGLDQRR